MTIELVYWIALGFGLGLLILSLLLGDVFDFLDIDLPGAEISVAPVFFAAVAAFGAGGLFGMKAFQMQTGGSIFMGLATGAGMGILTAGLFALLRRQEAKEGFELDQLVGLRGRATLAIGPGRVGKVQITHAGMTRSITATSNEEIGTGEEIVVRDLVGRTLNVSKSTAKG